MGPQNVGLPLNIHPRIVCLAVCEMSFVKCTLCHCPSVAVPIMISQTPCLMSKCHRHAGEFVKIL